MNQNGEHGVPKVHPATRPVEPEDPMELHAVEVRGDPELMLNVLVEEYARNGFDLQALMNLCRDPFYQGLYGLWNFFGEEVLRQKIITILGRCGVMKATVSEIAQAPETLVQLDHSGISDRS